MHGENLKLMQRKWFWLIAVMNLATTLFT